MSIAFLEYTVKEKGHSDMRFFVKAQDDVIEDVFVPFEGDKNNPDSCMNYRFENGSAKEAFWGMSLKEFRQRFEFSPHVKVGDVQVVKRELSAEEFRDGKILENQIMSHGKHASWRYLLSCLSPEKETFKAEMQQLISYFTHLH